MRPTLACALIAIASGCIEESQRASDADVVDTTPDVAPTGEPCDEPGITRCAPDANATELCLDGLWRRAACAESKICVNASGAQCVDSTGDESCRTTLYCFLACPIVHSDDEAAQSACFVDCYRDATQAGQRELSDLVACFDGCNGNDDYFGCIDERCSQDLADCYFDANGTTGCARILECLLGCGDDAAGCVERCGADATVEAQGEYAVLELCTFVYCVGQDAECPRRAALPSGVCGDYASACVSVLPDGGR